MEVDGTYYLVEFKIDKGLHIFPGSSLVCDVDPEVGQTVTAMYPTGRGKKMVALEASVHHISCDGNVLELKMEEMLIEDNESNADSPDEGQGNSTGTQIEKRSKRCVAGVGRKRPTEDDNEDGEAVRTKKQLIKNKKLQSEITAKNIINELKKIPAEMSPIDVTSPNHLKMKVESLGRENKRLRQERDEAHDLENNLQMLGKMVSSLQESAMYLKKVCVARTLEYEKCRPTLQDDMCNLATPLPLPRAPEFTGEPESLSAPPLITSLQSSSRQPAVFQHSEHLLYNAESVNVRELVAGSNVYISDNVIDALRASATKQSVLARGFTKTALGNCSTKGGLAKRALGRPSETREGLCSEAVSAILTYVRAFANTARWEPEKDKEIIKTMGTKLSEIRGRNKGAVRTAEPSTSQYV